MERLSVSLQCEVNSLDGAEYFAVVVAGEQTNKLFDLFPTHRISLQSSSDVPLSNKSDMSASTGVLPSSIANAASIGCRYFAVSMLRCIGNGMPGMARC